MERHLGISARLRVAIGLALLPLHLAACTTWRIQPIAPESLLVAESPAQVRLTLATGRQRTVRYPRLRADSIVGKNAWNLHTAVPLADIRQVELKRFDGTQTAIAVGFTALFVGIIALAVANGSWGSGGMTICCTDW